MSKIKKLLTICITVVMCATLFGVHTFADETTYTITINNDKNGHEYVAYQIFKGDVHTEGSTTYLSNIKWGDNIKGVELLEDLVDDANLSAHFSMYSSNDAAGIASKFMDTQMYQRLASHITHNLKDVGKTATKSGNTYVINGLEPGYYLVVDNAVQGSFDSTSDSLSRNILQVVKNVTVTPKSQGIPLLSKSVVNNNDSLSTKPDYPKYNFTDGATNNSTLDWQYLSDLQKSNVADHDIGDEVIYALNVSLPSDGDTLPTTLNDQDYAFSAKDYAIKITDTIQCPGLEVLGDTIRVFIGNGNNNAYKEITKYLNLSGVNTYTSEIGHYDNSYEVTTTNTGYPVYLNLTTSGTGHVITLDGDTLYYGGSESTKTKDLTTTARTDYEVKCLKSGEHGDVQAEYNGQLLYYVYDKHVQGTQNADNQDFDPTDPKNIYVNSAIDTNINKQTSYTELTFEIKNILSDNIKALNGEHIWIFYKCKLTDAAYINATGNPNKAKMEYSNSPTDKTSRGETKEDKAIVYTYEIDIHKVTNEAIPLDGADFKLEKLFKSYKVTLAADGKVKDLGLYGYYDSVKKTISFSSEDKVGKITEDTTYSDVYVEQLNKEIAGTTTPTTTASVFKYKGLDDGTYRLTETTTPAGYNTIDPIIFEVKSSLNEETGALNQVSLVTVNSSFNFTANSTNGVLQQNVVNKHGVVLPTTGGIGTTAFYVVGSLMVIGSLVALITKKRID